MIGELHMKKILTLLTATAVCATALCSPIAARKESNTVLIHNADTSFGNFSLDKTVKTEGSASLSVKLSGESFVAQTTLKEEVDITGCDTIAVDVYVSDQSKLAGVTAVYLEITSSGVCDKEEFQWEFLSQLKNSDAEDGWTTVYLDTSIANRTGTIDETAVNYLRFYTFQGGAASGLVLKLDNIRACYTGGEDYSDMQLHAYQGDNADAQILISGQSAPDLSKRDEGITKTAGFKK